MSVVWRAPPVRLSKSTAGHGKDEKGDKQVSRNADNKWREENVDWKRLVGTQNLQLASRNNLAFVEIGTKKSLHISREYGSWLQFWYGPDAEKAVDTLFKMYLHPPKVSGYELFTREQNSVSRADAKAAWDLLDDDDKQDYQETAALMNRRAEQRTERGLRFDQFIDILTAAIATQPAGMQSPKPTWIGPVNDIMLSSATQHVYNPSRGDRGTDSQPGWWLRKAGTLWLPAGATHTIEQWDHVLYDSTPILLDPNIAPTTAVTYRQYRILWVEAKRVRILPRVRKASRTGSPLMKEGMWWFDVEFFERQLVILPRDKQTIDDWNLLFFNEPLATLAQKADVTPVNHVDYLKWLTKQDGIPSAKEDGIPSRQRVWFLSSSARRRRSASFVNEIPRYVYDMNTNACQQPGNTGAQQFRFIQVPDKPAYKDWPITNDAHCVPDWAIGRPDFGGEYLAQTYMLDGDVIDADSEELWSSLIRSTEHQTVCLVLPTAMRESDTVMSLFPIKVAETREPWWPRLYSWWFQYRGDLRIIGAADALLSILWKSAPAHLRTWTEWVTTLWPTLTHRNHVLLTVYDKLIDQTGKEQVDRKDPSKADRDWASHHLYQQSSMSSIIHHLAQERDVVIRYMTDELVERKENAYTGFVEALLAEPYAYFTRGPSNIVTQKAQRPTLRVPGNVVLPVAVAIRFDEKDVKSAPVVRQFGGASDGGAGIKRALLFNENDGETDEKRTKRANRNETNALSPELVERERQAIMLDNKGLLLFVPDTELKVWSEWVAFFIDDPVANPVRIPLQPMPLPPILPTDRLSVSQFVNLAKLRGHRWRAVRSGWMDGISDKVIERDAESGEWLVTTSSTFYNSNHLMKIMFWNQLLYDNDTFTMHQGTPWVEKQVKLSEFLTLAPQRDRYLVPAIRAVVTPVDEKTLDQKEFARVAHERGYVHLPPRGSWLVPVAPQQQKLLIPADTHYSLDEWDRVFFGDSLVNVREREYAFDQRFTVTQYLARVRQPPIDPRPMVWVYDPLASSDKIQVLRRPTVSYASQVCLNSDDYITQEPWAINPHANKRMCTIYVPTSIHWDQFPKQGHCFVQESLVRALESSNEPIYEWLPAPTDGPNPIGERFYKLFYPNVLIDQASYRILAKDVGQMLVNDVGPTEHRYFLLIPTRSVSVGTLGGHEGEWGSFHGRTETIHSVFSLPVSATRESWWYNVYRWWWTYSGDLRVGKGESAAKLMAIFALHQPKRTAFELANTLCLIRSSQTMLFTRRTADTLQRLFSTRTYVGRRTPIGISPLTILDDIQYVFTTPTQPTVTVDMSTVFDATRYLLTMELLLMEIGRLEQERGNAIAYSNSIVADPAVGGLDLLLAFDEVPPTDRGKKEAVRLGGRDDNDSHTAHPRSRRRHRHRHHRSIRQARHGATPQHHIRKRKIKLHKDREEHPHKYFYVDCQKGEPGARWYDHSEAGSGYGWQRPSTPAEYANYFGKSSGSTTAPDK